MSDISNKAQEAAGKVKEKVGDVTGNDELKGEGQGDQVESKAKQAMDDAKDAVGDAAEKIRGMFKRD
ncbi:CsbD family protein [Streptacidiphilus sp. N1-12]|uniref:CsbD family protein n=2 Tax=Streptacidiphilus alkalitolerans TaxID=3342712 RepID=A0ABV6WQD1_9ACTN